MIGTMTLVLTVYALLVEHLNIKSAKDVRDKARELQAKAKAAAKKAKAAAKTAKATRRAGARRSPSSAKMKTMATTAPSRRRP